MNTSATSRTTSTNSLLSALAPFVYPERGRPFETSAADVLTRLILHATPALIAGIVAIGAAALWFLGLGMASTGAGPEEISTARLNGALTLVYSVTIALWTAVLTVTVIAIPSRFGAWRTNRIKLG